MKRVMLQVAYDGTDYSGFQAQKSGAPTIEGELNKALRDLTGESIEVSGASRTDAGVHARCNLAVFDTQSRIPGEKFAAALNVRLPQDIRVRGSREVAEDFHPRRCGSIKTYEYTIYNATYPDPSRERFNLFSYTPFDVEKMHRAAQILVGEHDFASFCSVYTQAKTTVRTILEISVTEKKLPSAGVISEKLQPREIVIRVSGTGFLYNMVRIIAGTLMEIGRGAVPEEQMQQILEGKDRRLAGPTAPPQGLMLADYHFTEFFSEIREEA